MWVQGRLLPATGTGADSGTGGRRELVGPVGRSGACEPSGEGSPQLPGSGIQAS